MSLRQLFEQIDDFICAPENVARLNIAILDLAVRGKLVRQEERDESAKELLRRIQVTKAQTGDTTSTVQASDVPFAVPCSWQWCRWMDVSVTITDVDHKMPVEQPSGIPYISPKDFTSDGKIDFANAKKITYEDFLVLAERVKPERGDLIFPRYGTIGVNRLVETDLDFLASYSCAIVKYMRGYIDPRYVYYYSLSSLVKSEISITAQGCASIGWMAAKRKHGIVLPSLPMKRRQCHAKENCTPVSDLRNLPGT